MSGTELQAKFNIQAAVTGTNQVDQLNNALQGTTNSTQQVTQAGERFLSTLQRQASEVGKTKAQLLEMRAAQLGVSEQAAPLIERFKTLGTVSGQTANAMRMIPAQMTDIVVSLSSGQAPMTVLLQQGGQLKDMFGGIGPAIRGVAAYVAGMINPFTLAAAAVAGVAYEMYQGYNNAQEYTRIMKLTGDSLGMTRGQLDQMASTLSGEAATSTQAARETLLQLAQTGQFTSDNLHDVALAVQDYAKVSGQDSDKVVADFAKMKSGVAQWAAEHNDQLHFMSLAQYEHIENLEKMGDKSEAMRQVSAALHKQMGTTDAENVGYLVRAWRALKGAIDGAAEAMRNWGAAESKETQLSGLKAELAELQKNYKTAVPGMDQGMKARIDYLQKTITTLEQTTAAEQKAKKEYAEGQKVQADGINGQRTLNDLSDQFASKKDKEAAAIKKVTDAYAAAVRANPGNVEQYKAQYENAVAGIHEQYKEREKHPRAAREDHTFDNKVESYQNMLESAQHLTELEKLNADIAEGKYSKLLPSQIQYLRNKALEVDTQRKMNEEAKDEESTRKKEQADADRKAEQDKRNNEALTEYVEKIRNQKNELVQSKEAAQDFADSQELVRHGIEKGTTAFDDWMKKLKQARAEVKAANMDWRNGAIAGLNDVVDKSSNVAQQVQKSVSGAFDKMTDAVVEFSMTGKLSFKDFARSIIADMVRIAAQMAITGIAKSILGGMFGVTTQANGGAWSGGVQFFANGGVVDRTTAFATSTGLGIMGEAGPEAIMPLSRGSDGKLGVKAQGGGAASVSIVINVDASSGSTDTSSSGDTTGNMTKLGGLISNVVRQEIMTQLRPGGLLQGAA